MDRGGLTVADQSAQRKRGLAVACPDPLSSSLPLFGSRYSHLSTREYFHVFYIVHPDFALLCDLIFLRYCILSCDNCVLVLFLGMYITIVFSYSNSYMY